MGGGIKRAVVGMVGVVVLTLTLGVSAASAQVLSPWWHVNSASRPSYLAPGGKGEIVATAANVGDAPVNGGGCHEVGEGQGKYTNSECTEPEPPVPGVGDYEKTPVQITDTLPAGLTAAAAVGAIPKGGEATPIPCSVVTTSTVTCEMTGSLAAFGFIEVRVEAVVEPGVQAPQQGVNEHLKNTVCVEGGQTPSACASKPIRLSGEATPFGVGDYELTSEEEGGLVDERAGSHPFQLTMNVNLDESADTSSLSEPPEAQPVALARDLHFKWPPGLIGNPTAVPSCPLAELLQTVREENKCPADTAIGVARVSAPESFLGVVNETVPLFNVEAEKGEPARFGFTASGSSALIDVSVRSGEDYGLTLKLDNITQDAALLGASVTIWGTPGDPSHADVRGYGCLFATLGRRSESVCEGTPEVRPRPLLSLPVACTGALRSDVEGDSWLQANEQQAEGIAPTLAPLATTIMPALHGCAGLPFAPEIAVAPDVSDTSTPSGFDVDLHVPQESSENPAGVVSSPIKEMTVALPAGVTLNPAGAEGLEACSESQVGFEGFEGLDPGEPAVQTQIFTPTLPEPLQPGLNFCPSAAKVGTVTLRTPILGNPLQGTIYLASQNANPFSSFLAGYIVAKDPVSGTLVKLGGGFSLNPASGQITAKFEGIPQIPIEDIELDFFGGERALLATPAHCGSYTTTASFTPWSGNPAANVSSTFDITSGPKDAPSGSGCPPPELPFNPSLTGGATNIEAGSFSPLTATLSREDGQQALQGFQLRLPPGLTGMISKVPLCPEVQATEGTCSSASQIGETTVSAGVGGDPYKLRGGKVYLTGPYSGTGTCVPGGTQSSSSSCAPFGLSIVTPVKAGPLDLENTPENHPACDCLVIRAKIEVDPQTAQLTIASGGIPNIIDGIPLQIKHLNITIDRPGFIVNPTDCAGLRMEGTVAGSEGATAAVSSPFRVANCATLKFKPKLTASTRANGEPVGHGASLHVVIRTGSSTGAGTATANIARLKLDLPKQLPTRLTTLQKACRKAVFTANPAKCPASSVVGTAKVATPVLPVTMAGPAYFVSNGRESLPDIDIVLEGDGVRLNLRGSTFVSKKDVTSVTFGSVPDIPLRSFELMLPEGTHSALGTETHLCKQKLAMPAALTGENGAVVHTSVGVGVSGCPKARGVARGRKVRIERGVPSTG